MSESGDYDPGPWKGHDFGTARKAYDVHAGRSYDDAVNKGKTNADLIAPKLTTDSPSPLIVFFDVTGSMGEWPAVICSKLPYLDIEGKEYLGKKMAICFGAFGDANSDTYPLQGRPFATGLELKERLKELVVEGNGGGQLHETSELAALYCARNIETPKAVHKPILVLITDEKPYDYVTKDQAQRYAHVRLEGSRLDTSKIFDEIKDKYACYLLLKPYDAGRGDSMSANSKAVYETWLEHFDAEHIALLPDPNRVVDVIFGILAKETNRVAYFRGEIEDRQKPEQVDTAYKALKTIHALPAATDDGTDDDGKKGGHTGKSIMRTTGKGGKKTKPLL